MTCFVFLSVKAAVFSADLQTLIDQAEEHEVIVFPSGVYKGPIEISKPLTLIGEGEVVIETEEQPSAITVVADEVKIENISIQHQSMNRSTAAIIIKGDHNELKNIKISTTAMGIVLDHANENLLENISIEGAYRDLSYQASMDSREGNAIDLFYSHYNQIKNVQIEYAQDGIYIESSDHNLISDSKITHSRYGVHLMFTTNTKLMNNTSTENVTGMMVMGTRGTQIIHNELSKMNAHVHSQGLMLYDVQNANIMHNQISENLIGLFVENSQNNLIQNNIVHANYIGIQFSKAKDNEVTQNDFLSNVISAYGEQSNENVLEANFWEGQQTIDLDSDGKSDLPFYADPIFPTLVMKKPAYQIFADSPGLLFFQFLLDENRDHFVKDISPATNPNVYPKSEKTQGELTGAMIYGMISSILLLFFYIGGKQR